jgi:uncharacterized protein
VVAAGADTEISTRARLCIRAFLNALVSVATWCLGLKGFGPWNRQPPPRQVAETVPPLGTRRTLSALTPVVVFAWVNEARSMALAGSWTWKASVAGVGSALPAASSARTANVWSPAASGGAVSGDAQAAKAPSSRLHWNVAPATGEANAKVGEAFVVTPGGPETIMVSGPATWASVSVARRATSMGPADATGGGTARAIPGGGIVRYRVLDVIWNGLKDAFLMAWEVWWALVFGFAISAIVQAWVPRARIESALSGSGPRPVTLAGALGAASSSCSYAAVAIAKSLFQKGASAATALAFQFASTNLVWELGLVLWVLIGWQFTLAEYVGGALMIVLMALGLRLFVSPRLEKEAREHARQADTGHQHHAAAADMPLRERLRSAAAWSDVAHNFRGDWTMLYKEIALGFLLAGFVAQLGDGFFNGLFIQDGPGVLRELENAVVGPLIAVLSFVCSVGNVPLAAVLWSGGISFAGVLAFLFADLIVLPILLIYRKYYGTAYTVRIVALMLVTMIVAALVVAGVFLALGLVPSGPRPSRADVFGGLEVNYKLALNVLALAVFGALFWLTARRGATDPVCGMKVDRARAIHAHGHFFCSEHCRHAYESR